MIDPMRGRKRTRTADQETIVVIAVGGILHLFDDVINIEFVVNICAHQESETLRSVSRKPPPEVISSSDEVKYRRNSVS